MVSVLRWRIKAERGYHSVVIGTDEVGVNESRITGSFLDFCWTEVIPQAVDFLRDMTMICICLHDLLSHPTRQAVSLTSPLPCFWAAAPSFSSDFVWRITSSQVTVEAVTSTTRRLVPFSLRLDTSTLWTMGETSWNTFIVLRASSTTFS